LGTANSTLDERAVARQPRQLRARVRFDQVMDAAESLLSEHGLGGFSIPAVADKLGYTRASIYKFFPTPYAVLNELVTRKLGELEQRLMQLAPQVLPQPWPQAMRAMVLKAAAFYNADLVARILVLGGPVTDDSYRAQELTIQRLGGLARELLLTRGIQIPKARPDAAMLLVEVGTTCFRVSQFLHGRITPEYQEEAVAVMQSYLSRHVAVPAAARARSAR
jgi:AcrR family transcriptional regulator